MPASPRVSLLTALFVLLVATISAPALSQQADTAAPDELEAAKGVRRQGNVAGVESQKRVDSLSGEADELFTRYRNALRQTDSMRVYNRQLKELIGSQQEELTSLADQLDRVELVGRSVTPLMLRMIAAMESFVELDLPFLRDERSMRVEELRKLMVRADVNNAEKYRRIMEAYQIENEYGRTIEAYRGSLTRDGRERKVDFLRFGRISLVYQTLDGNESGVWDQENGSWQVLDDSYRTAIREGLRVARKQAAPDLIRLPLPAADEVEG